MDKKPSNVSAHDHSHGVNRFAVIPTADRLNTDPRFTGRGVTIAFLDSGFHRHPDLVEPNNRVMAFHDISGEEIAIEGRQTVRSWHWHGTQTTVAAAGHGQLCGGENPGLAADARLLVVEISPNGPISEDKIGQRLRLAI